MCLNKFQILDALYCLILLALLGVSCSNDSQIQSGSDDEMSPILGERINGQSNVRDTVNGDLLFELKTNTLVECTDFENEWCQVMVMVDAPKVFNLDSKLKKGTYLMQGDDTVGVVRNDMDALSILNFDEKNMLELYGFTHRDNIQIESIIENVFNTELKHGNRDLKNWQSFMQSFQMDSNAFSCQGLVSYFYYENVIDDPSPGFRLVLLFHKNTLIGFVHTRSVAYKEVVSKLCGRYTLSFFKDFPNFAQMQFETCFKKFLNTAD
jgi:hypothetical protein